MPGLFAAPQVIRLQGASHWGCQAQRDRATAFIGVRPRSAADCRLTPRCGT